MKKWVTAALLSAACAAVLLPPSDGMTRALAACKDDYQRTAPDYDNSYSCRLPCTFTYRKHWVVYFLDGYKQRINPAALGDLIHPVYCPPSFESPTFVDNTRTSALWSQYTHEGRITVQHNGMLACSISMEPERWTIEHECQRADGGGGGCTTAGWDGSCPPGTYPNESGMCCSEGGGDAGLCELGCGWSFAEGQCLCNSPVLVDVAGDGFRLTDAPGGVRFDLNRDGERERLAWTQAGSDDAWLALDVDGDGAVSDGGELFGNYTRQPRPPDGQQKNGFLALAVYDRPAVGGDGDGVLDGDDAVFPLLRLWRDANHDGVSQAGELHTLSSLGLSSVALDYRESGRRDAYGNRFRYRAEVADSRGARLGRWAYDVFLVSGPPEGGRR